MRIGVLALQGAFREHQRMFEKLGVETVLVKKPEQLEGLDGIVIPGGESTAIGKLLREYRLIEPIKEMGNRGVPVFGTCAGMIVMSKHIANGEAPHLGLMDVTVNRNSFGRQVDSFEADIAFKDIGEAPYPAVFIRAPHIESVGEACEVLGTYQDRIVAVKEGNLLALSFHPELTDDTRFHELFVKMIESTQKHAS